MRTVLSATLLVVAVGGAAEAQMQAPTTAGAKPKPVTTTTIRPPKTQTPADTANAMAQAERLALQSDLAWVGEYNGAISGEVSDRMVNAIKEFQKSRGGKQTGALNPQERGILADTARRRQENVGWKIVSDPGTGVRLGIPSKLAPQQNSPSGTSVHRPAWWRDWLLAGAFAVGFLGVVFAVQWRFSAFLLSDAADNRFFARSGHWPYFAQPGEWMNRFWDFEKDPITFKAMALAFVRAFISARIGLWLGNYLLRLKR